MITKKKLCFVETFRLVRTSEINANLWKLFHVYYVCYGV
jgi:hypothetical protein